MAILLARYACDDNAASTVVLASTGNNAVLSGGDNTSNKKGGGASPGQLGTSLLLNGTDDYFSAQLTSAVSYPFSVSGWLVPSTAPGLGAYLSVLDASSTTKFFYLLRSSGNPVRIFRRNGGTNVSLDLSFSIPMSVPTHLAIVYVSSTAIQVYKNGALTGSFTGLAPVTLDTGYDDICIGALRTTSPIYHTPSSYDDVRIYSGALSSGEVQTLFDLGKPFNSVAPVVSGTPTVGETLSSTTGTWTDGSATYQWYRANDGSGTGATAIPGATSSTHVVGMGDIEKHVQCRVTFTNSVGSNVSQSNYVGPVSDLPSKSFMGGASIVGGGGSPVYFFSPRKRLVRV